MPGVSMTVTPFQSNSLVWSVVMPAPMAMSSPSSQGTDNRRLPGAVLAGEGQAYGYVFAVRIREVSPYALDFALPRRQQRFSGFLEYSLRLLGPMVGFQSRHGRVP